MTNSPSPESVAAPVTAPASDAGAAGILDLDIGGVERDIGLSKDTLRIWERRYGFPKPARNAYGERTYAAADLEKLRLIKLLIGHGARPGRIVHDSIDSLRAQVRDLPQGDQPAPGGPSQPQHVATLVTWIAEQRVETVRRQLLLLQLEYGLPRFFDEILAPLTSEVGRAWSDGRITLIEEHLYTEMLQTHLRQTIGACGEAKQGPRIVLTTLPGEVHCLGLLMAQALFSLAGCQCVALGTQTPVDSIAACVQTQLADVVALSFSAMYGTSRIRSGLTELRNKLGPKCSIWVGGASPGLAKRRPAGITVIDRLSGIDSVVAGWRSTHRTQ
jgi:MerR family transcriptional regulator, light-induced transcriptional regulator